MTNKELLEKLQEDMELRRIFKVHKVQLLSQRKRNYCNSIIRFIYDVVLDKPINQKQIPMLKGKIRLPKILSDEELNVFFNACENYEYKTIYLNFLIFYYKNYLKIEYKKYENINKNNC